jgi:hypothetical protein
MPSWMRVAAEVRSWPVGALGVLLLVSGCAGLPTPASQDDAMTAVVTTIDAFNTTAGGPVAGQQAALDQLVSSGQSAVQSRCPPAKNTITFEPVYARLAPAPDWKPSSGTLPGAVYSLPTLIRVYTGDRITSTDLTDLHLSVEGGKGWLPALCLS